MKKKKNPTQRGGKKKKKKKKTKKGGGGGGRGCTLFLQSIEYYSESHKVVVLILNFFIELISLKVPFILNRGKNIKSARKCNFITCMSKNNDIHCNDK